MLSLTYFKIAEENFLKFVQVKRRKNRWRSRVKKFVGKEKVLTVSQKNEVMEFYKDYAKTDMIFHEFYTKKSGKFFNNYIPDDMHYCKIDPFFNDWDSAHYLDNKCYYDNWYFKGINMPKTLIKCINGMWMIPTDKGLSFISKEEAYELISQHDCFVKQAKMSAGGHGVHKIKKGTSVDEINRIINSLGTEIIVQEPIEQSDELCKLNPSSVNTIRVLSFLNKDGSVKIYSAIVRMGVNDAVVDNASSGGITCGIEPDGRLKSVAYSASGTRYDKHPNTGLQFNEVVIPNYDKIFSLVQKLHKDFPSFRLLSWDIAVDKNDNPLLVEVNLCYGELDFHQLNNGPVFGNDTKKILDEVFGKQ